MDTHVRIFDTTLRDGEQSPGATMTSAEKMEVARVLSRIGVDVIEAGFPAASLDDLEAVRAIAQTVGVECVDGRISAEPPTICGLARTTQNDIDKAWAAVRFAKHPRIHTFLATSPIHREHKLRMTKAQVLEKTREMVGYARALCADIEFSPEDAGRTEPDFLYEVLEVALDAGATTLNIPDTVGYTTPDEFGRIIAGIKENVRGIDRAIISVHCHNDLGLATANTLAGIRAGARQAEVAVNGIGERAGNASLEEVVMALQTRKRYFGLGTDIDSTQIMRLSKLVSTVTGMSVQPNKAIVGANAFAHESGIHQDGMLKHHETYEIMRPETVGLAQTQLVLGKHSGRHAFGVRLSELGYNFQGQELDVMFTRFKALADRKKNITGRDLEALVASELFQQHELYSLDTLQVACGTTGLSTATVRLRCPDGTLGVNAAVGDGPVDACFKSIDGLIHSESALLEYTVHAVTPGVDAMGEVSVRVRANGTGARHSQHSVSRAKVFHGHGADTDIIIASAKAYLAALNRLVVSEHASKHAEQAQAVG